VSGAAACKVGEGKVDGEREDGRVAGERERWWERQRGGFRAAKTGGGKDFGGGAAVVLESEGSVVADVMIVV